MAYRNGNYCAFYVAEPFHESSLAAHATKDFVYYNMLRAWKAKNPSFPFIDSHAKTYSVRDGSDWERTLKPRLRERLQSSKNIVLFLSSATISSVALNEEIEYGVENQGLPVIVVYPDFKTKASLLLDGALSEDVKKMWSRLPTFKRLMPNVPTLHIPLNQEAIVSALTNSDFSLISKTKPNIYRYSA